MLTRSIAIVVVLIAGLSGIAPAWGQTVIDDSFPADAGVDLETVHKAISADFADPQSAQYKGMTLRGAIANDPVICGWVNAKNSMGGYTPFVPFHYSVNRAKGAIHEGLGDDVTKQLTLTALASSGCSAAALGL